jgi:predicted N-acyltransferase
MYAEVFNSINDIPEKEWNDLVVSENAFLKHHYLRVVEESMSFKYKFWYLAIRDDEKIVALVALFSMPVYLDMLSSGAIRHISEKVRKIYKNFLVTHPLFVGSPPSISNNTIIISESVNKSEVLGVIVEAVEKIAVENHLQIIAYKEFEDEDCVYMDKLSNQYNYIKVNSLPTNKLSIKWDSFDEYMKSLKTPYRQSINANFRKLNSGDIKAEVITEFGEVFNDYHFGLYEAVMGKAEFQLEKLTAEYFKRIADVPDNEACMVSLKRDDLVLGYFLVSNSGKNSISAMFAGINYEYSRQFDIYFNLFYEVIKLAIERKKDIIEFGQNSYHFKSRIGCLQYPLYIYIRHRNKFWQCLIKKLAPILFPKTELKDKNVFKPERS